MIAAILDVDAADRRHAPSFDIVDEGIGLEQHLGVCVAPERRLQKLCCRRRRRNDHHGADDDRDERDDEEGELAHGHPSSL